MVMPGDNVTLGVKLIAPIAMDQGLRFAIREGGRTVGAGRCRNDLQVISRLRALDAGKARCFTRSAGPFRLWHLFAQRDCTALTSQMKLAIYSSGMRAMTLISKSNPASQLTPIAVQLG